MATKDAEVTQEVKDKDGKVLGTQLGIDESKVKEIVAGWYATEDGHTTSVAHWLSEEDFAKNGGVMNHETVESITKRENLLLSIIQDLVGHSSSMVYLKDLNILGLAPKMQVFDSGNVQDMCGEDVSFCLDAKKKVSRHGAIHEYEWVMRRRG